MSDRDRPVPKFSELLSQPLDTFLTKTLGRDLLHVPGDPSRFAELFGWEVLNHILMTQRLETARVHVVRDGGVIPHAKFSEPVPLLFPNGGPRRLRTDLIAEHLGNGDTLIFDSVEEVHLPLREFAQSLERMLRGFVQINVYVSAGTSHGFTMHWDDHEIFVLQIAGRKNWRVYGPTLEVPILEIADQPKPEGREPVFDKNIQAGDMLYLPRGWWHEARAIGEPTIHLSVSCRQPSALELARRMLDTAAGTDERLRENVPLYATGQEREEWSATIAGILRDVFPAEKVAAEPMWTEKDTVPDRPVSALPMTIGRNELWRINRDRGVRLRAREDRLSNLMSALRQDTPAQRALRNGDLVTISTLANAAADEDRFFDALTQAARLGHVEIA